jgi:cytochrome c
MHFKTTNQIGRFSLAAAALFHSGALLATGPVGDPVKGKAVFARCVICHTVEPGKNKLGPTLAGIVGSKAGEVPGFNFSPAMKASKIVWTPANLDKYLTNPRSFMPGNRMIFMGLPNADDRANVIAYLKKPVK